VKPLHGHAELDERKVLKTIDRVSGRPLKAPFYAIKVTGALFHTQGGLEIDAQCRVLSAEPSRAPATHSKVLEKFILGLWAGGGAARGVSGSNVEGYLSGNGLLSAFAGGWIAAQSIMESLKP
jgi:fumarate reductase flavoprotein subunit